MSAPAQILTSASSIAARAVDEAHFLDHSSAGGPALEAKPPLKSRLQANRENARKSTGPKTPEGKARSRANAVSHGLTAKVAVPKETMIEIAEHFWQLVNSYRPTGAVAVNAILELTLCSWKYRRLFEHYAGHTTRSKLVVNLDRRTREKRLAQRWFARIASEPRKAVIHLERTLSGLTIMIEAIDNLIAELRQIDGSWTSHQYELAVNLAGFHYHDTWNHVHLRDLWSAWYGCRSVRKSSPDDIQPFLHPNPEYKARSRKAIDNAPLPAEGRRALTEWATGLRDRFCEMRTEMESLDEELAALAPMTAGWPAPEETSQHLLHLRYTNMVDRKTRELQALIANLPAATKGETWRFDEELLPSDWKAVLIQHRTLRAVEKGIDDGEITTPVAEFLMKNNVFEIGAKRELKCAMNSVRHEKEGRKTPAAMLLEEYSARKLNESVEAVTRPAASSAEATNADPAGAKSPIAESPRASEPAPMPGSTNTAAPAKPAMIDRLTDTRPAEKKADSSVVSNFAEAAAQDRPVTAISKPSQDRFAGFAASVDSKSPKNAAPKGDGKLMDLLMSLTEDDLRQMGAAEPKQRKFRPDKPVEVNKVRHRHEVQKPLSRKSR